MEKGYLDKAYRWNRENYSRRRRFLDIWSFVLLLMFKLWRYNKSWSYPGGVTEAKQAARRKAQAVWIRSTLLDLGPTFIKVGQLFSTRADIFPSEYVEELAKLQDKVPAFSYEQVETIIEQELGKKIPEAARLEFVARGKHALGGTKQLLPFQSVITSWKLRRHDDLQLALIGYGSRKNGPPKGF